MSSLLSHDRGGGRGAPTVELLVFVIDVVRLVVEGDCGNEDIGEVVDGGLIGVEDPGRSHGLGGEVRLMILIMVHSLQDFPFSQQNKTNKSK